MGTPRSADGLPGHAMIPSFINKVTTKDAKSAKEDEAYLLQIYASFARFLVTSLRSF